MLDPQEQQDLTEQELTTLLCRCVSDITKLGDDLSHIIANYTKTFADGVSVYEDVPDFQSKFQVQYMMPTTMGNPDLIAVSNQHLFCVDGTTIHVFHRVSMKKLRNWEINGRTPINHLLVHEDELFLTRYGSEVFVYSIQGKHLRTLEFTKMTDICIYQDSLCVLQEDQIVKSDFLGQMKSTWIVLPTTHTLRFTIFGNQLALLVPFSQIRIINLDTLELSPIVIKNYNLEQLATRGSQLVVVRNYEPMLYLFDGSSQSVEFPLRLHIVHCCCDAQGTCTACIKLTNSKTTTLCPLMFTTNINWLMTFFFTKQKKNRKKSNENFIFFLSQNAKILVSFQRQNHVVQFVIFEPTQSIQDKHQLHQQCCNSTNLAMLCSSTNNVATNISIFCMIRLLVVHCQQCFDFSRCLGMHCIQYQNENK